MIDPHGKVRDAFWLARQRVEAEYGRVGELVCDRCLRPATRWVLNQFSKNIVCDVSWRQYSDVPADYHAMCARCETEYGRLVSREGDSPEGRATVHAWLHEAIERVVNVFAPEPVPDMFSMTFKRVEGASLLGRDAFDAYLAWCEYVDAPLKARVRRTTLYADLEARGVTRTITNKGVAFVGIALL